MNQHNTSAPASPIVRPMAPLVVLLVAVLGLSCQYQPAILISATIPSGVTRLQVFATLDGHSSNEVLDIPVAARSTDGRYSFVLSLPQAATARLLLLRVGGRDSSGCLVATGLGQSELSAKPSDATQLSVSLSPLPAPSGCGDVLPVLLSVSPLTWSHAAFIGSVGSRLFSKRAEESVRSASLCAVHRGASVASTMASPALRSSVWSRASSIRATR